MNTASNIETPVFYKDTVVGSSWDNRRTIRWRSAAVRAIIATGAPAPSICHACVEECPGGVNMIMGALWYGSEELAQRALAKMGDLYPISENCVLPRRTRQTQYDEMLDLPPYCLVRMNNDY